MSNTQYVIDNTHDPIAVREVSVSFIGLLARFIAFVAVLVVVGFVSIIGIVAVLAGTAVGTIVVAISRRVRRVAPQLD